MEPSIKGEQVHEKVGGAVDDMMGSQAEAANNMSGSCRYKTTGDEDPMPLQKPCSKGNQKEDDTAQPSFEDKIMNSMMDGKGDGDTSASLKVPHPSHNAMAMIMAEEVQSLPEREVKAESIPGAHAVSTQVEFANPARFSSLIAGSMRRVIDESLREDLEDQIHDGSVHVVGADEENGDQDCHLAGVIAGNQDCHQGELIEGKILEEPKDTQDNERGRPGALGWFLLLGCAMVGLAAVLFLVILVGPSVETDPDSDASPAAAPAATAAPVIHHTPFEKDLPQAVTTAINEDSDSAFYKANKWVLMDPSFSSYTPERRRQRFYLAMLYYATNGDSWTESTNWLSYEVSECHWFTRSSFPPDSPYFEPEICQNNSVVSSLSLASNNLTGTLPIWYTPYIPFLKVIDVDNNSIHGLLPPVTSTPFLEVLILSNNPFEGAIVFNAGPFYANLKVVRTDSTSLNGNNGGAFQRIVPKIEVINYTAMPNDGLIWPSFGVAANLVYLGFGHKDTAHGTIPTELGSLTAIREIDFSSLPKVHGTIPSELGLLTQLTKLDLTGTPVTGAVPAEICRLVDEGSLELCIDCSSLLRCCHV